MIINPQIVYGSWKEGYALDFHVLYSNFLGNNEFGHPEFDTKRTEIGELMYALKYKGDLNALDKIVDCAIGFLTSWLGGKGIKYIVPAPFSSDRAVQPVMQIAKNIAEKCDKIYRDDFFCKTKTPSSKDGNKEIEIKTLKREVINGSVLLIDDLFDTGATLNACVKALQEDLNVSTIYVLCMTKTRRKIISI